MPKLTKLVKGSIAIFSNFFRSNFSHTFSRPTDTKEKSLEKIFYFSKKLNSFASHCVGSPAIGSRV